MTKQASKKKFLIPLALILIAAVAVFMLTRKPAASAAEASTLTESTVEQQDLSVTLSATGTVQPANQYSITTNLNGEILAEYFEEGDEVEEGQLLYEIDDSDAVNSVEKAALTLQKQQLSYQETMESLDKLNIRADDDGTVITLYVKVGDQVNNGTKIADVRNSAVMELTVPFNSYDVDDFYVGQGASVTIDGSFETLYGSITAIAGAERVENGYQIVRDVTIAVSNPGGLSTSTVATAAVGDALSNSSANFTYSGESTITAETSGKVESLNIREGSTVSNGQTVAVLSSTNITNQVTTAQINLQDTELSYDNTVSKLDDYNITAPISGTVITKNSKKGDNLSANGSTTMALIYDLSYLTFDISLDELDIGQVTVGQQVIITCEAISQPMFYGEITKVSVAGTTQNGVTSYPVTVQIDNVPDGLLPGMNVEATIVVASASDVLAIPTGALQRGNRVYVKDETATNTEGLKVGGETLPDGWKMVQVEVGMSDENFVEITSGLEEGDVVLVTQASNSTNWNMGNFGGDTTFFIAGGDGSMTSMPAGGGPMQSSGGSMPAGGSMPSGGGMRG